MGSICSCRGSGPTRDGCGYPRSGGSMNAHLIPTRRWMKRAEFTCSNHYCLKATMAVRNRIEIDAREKLLSIQLESKMGLITSFSFWNMLGKRMVGAFELLITHLQWNKVNHELLAKSKERVLIFGCHLDSYNEQKVVEPISNVKVHFFLKILIT